MCSCIFEYLKMFFFWAWPDSLSDSSRIQQIIPAEERENFIFVCLFVLNNNFKTFHDDVFWTKIPGQNNMIHSDSKGRGMGCRVPDMLDCTAKCWPLWAWDKDWAQCYMKQVVRADVWRAWMLTSKSRIPAKYYGF